ncbi:hypothetical protein CKA32_003746 [Geitlerinema sp. FC II]|nr:hypothetical protein [Baaleninema simplex]PPT06816.1 hypothetical protein CKA32_003746 [Geitlerinema sp. FC II]
MDVVAARSRHLKPQPLRFWLALARRDTSQYGGRSHSIARVVRLPL